MDLDWLDDKHDLETDFIPEARMMARSPAARTMIQVHKAIAIERKRLFSRRTKETDARAAMPRLPAPGETFHVVSRGTFDFWNLIPITIEYMGGKVAEVYGSTWTLNRDIALQILELLDNGTIGRFSLLTGIYFKRRESAVYATILTGLQQRRQRYIAFRNHCKVALVGDDPNYITLEGSANFTANPRLEQFVITNDRQVYDFHRNWMEETYSG